MKGTAQTDGIRVNCICPGFVDTPEVRQHFKLNLLRSDDVHRILCLSLSLSILIHQTMHTHTHSLCSTEQVADAVLQLITDTSKAGDVMAVTFDAGITFPKLLDVADLYPQLVGQKT